MKSQTVDLELSPLDNRALANLCGALDSNLRQVESALDVTIARRGATFTLRGASSQIERAATALAACEPVNPQALAYLNRLSDYLFVLARAINVGASGDVQWVPGANR